MGQGQYSVSDIADDKPPVGGAYSLDDVVDTSPPPVTLNTKRGGSSGIVPPRSRLVQTSPYMPGAPARFEEMGSQEISPAAAATTEASHAGVGIGLGAPGYPKIVSGARKIAASGAMPGSSYYTPPQTLPTPEELKQRQEGTTEFVSGIGEAATPLMAEGIGAQPIRAALGLGAGYAASKGAKAVTQAAGGSKEAQDVAETLGFWAPTLAGTILRPQTTTLSGPGVKAGAVSVLGGKAGGFAGVDPDQFAAGVKAGPFEAAVRIPRSGNVPVPEGPQGPALPPADPATIALANFEARNGAAQRVVNGQPAVPPPPPEPPISANPLAPKSVQQGSISPEDVAKVAQMVAGLPPNIRAQAIQETHGTLTKVLLEQGQRGPVVLPSGQLAIIRDEAAAEKTALSIINDAVKEHDKVTEAIAGQKGKEGERRGLPPAAPQKPGRLRQRAQELTQTGKYSLSDVVASQEGSGATSEGKAGSEVTKAEGSAPRALESVGEYGRVSESIGGSSEAPAHAGTASQRVGEVLPPARGETTQSEVGKETTAGNVPQAPAGGENGADRGPLKKGDQVTLAKDLDVGGKTLKAGTPATVNYIHPNGLVVRAVTSDGTKISKGMSAFTRGVESSHEQARGESGQRPVPSETDRSGSGATQTGRGRESLAPGVRTPETGVRAEPRNRDESASDLPAPAAKAQPSTEHPVAPHTNPRLSPDLAEWKAPPELGAVSSGADVGAKARATIDKETGPLKRGEERRKIERTGQQESDRIFAQARKELGEHASSEEVGKRVEELRAPAKYKFGNTQANIHPSSEAAKALESARARISDSDLAGKGKEIGDGGNHVTVRYGIKGEDTEGIKKFLSQQAPFEASLGKTEKFPPSEHSDGAAVIIAPIEAPELHRLNAELEKHGDFSEPSFKEYKPHATIAYVDPAKADRYTGMSVTQGKKFTIDSVAVSKKDGSQEIVKLGGKANPEAAKTGTLKQPWEMSRAEYQKSFPPTRIFQKYDSEARASRQASHRMGPVAKSKVGEFFYTTPHVPDRGFDTAGKAADAGHKAVVEKAASEGKPAPGVIPNKPKPSVAAEAKPATPTLADRAALDITLGKAEKIEPPEAISEEGKNFEGRYVRAALEPVKAAWLNLIKSPDSPEDNWKWMVENFTDSSDKPSEFPKGHLFIKVPDDGSFYIPNTPAAINHALKAAGKFESSQVGEALPKGGPKKFRMVSPKEFDTEKYIVGIKKEIADLEDQARSETGSKYDFIQEQLKAARENLAEAKQQTPESILAGESGSLEPGKLADAVKGFVEKDIHPALKHAGLNMKDVAGFFVKTFYPRIEDSNPIGKALGVAAPSDAVDALMKVQGDRAKALAEFDLVLKATERMFDRLPEEERVDFVDRIQTGAEQPSPDLRDLAEIFTKVMDGQRDAEEDALNLGRSKEVTASAPPPIELSRKANYFHNWWDTPPDKEPAEDEGDRISRQFMPRRPLEGTKGYNKQQSYTLKSGMAAGGEPVTTNPVRILRRRIEDGMKFVTARKAWHELENLDLRTFVKKGSRPPEGFDKIDDKIAKVWFRAELDFGGDKTVTAPHEMGEWYVEANTARLLNNMLSVDKIRANALGRSLMWLKNASTALELGLSPFHAVFETIEAASSQLSLGLSRSYNLGVRQGNLAELAKGVTEMATSPIAPITLAREGATIPAYIEARARLNAIGLTEYGHVISGDQPHGILDAVKQFQEVRKEKAIQKLIKRYPDIDQLIDDMFQGGLVIGQHRDYQVKALGKSVAEAWTEGNPIGAVLRGIPTVLQGTMHPLFNWYIPSLKYSLFFRMMSEAAMEHSAELENGSLTRETLARQVADSVENRFGELNFDNLFLNRSVKTALQFIFRSATYKLGTAREFTGAVGGQARELTRWAQDAYQLASGAEGTEGKTTGEKALPRLDARASWVASLMLTTAFIGAIAAKLLSHKWPWEWLEDDKKEGKTAGGALLLETTHPRTGETDSRGKPVRVSLPTYWKDVEHATSNPGQYALSSLSTILSRSMDVAENRDYFKNYVYNPHADPFTKAKQIGKYAFPTPFVASSYQRGQQQGHPKLAWLSAFGFPKAPSDLDFTPAEKLAQQIIKDNEAPATPEEMEAWRAKHDAFVNGKLPLSQARAFMKRQRETMLQRQMKNSAMDYASARRVYDLGTPEERQSLDHIMREKRARLMRQHRGAEVEAAAP